MKTFTEIDAAKKWCHISFGGPNGEFMPCCGSACMAWVVIDEAHSDEDNYESTGYCGMLTYQERVK